MRNEPFTISIIKTSVPLQMECLAPAVAAANLRPPFICASRKKESNLFKAKLRDEDDPVLQSAINGAFLRFQETQRPEPLFLDPYAGCFLGSDVQMVLKQNLSGTFACHYCLATKFIDDKLLSVVNRMDGVRQIVLLTDGMDTRPYRLRWPNSTIFFGISPDLVFKRAVQKLEGVGAKIPKSCLFLHVPSESSNIQQTLCRKGFNGNRPSIWILQGLSMMTVESFKDILCIVSSLAMEGCFFVGELPAGLGESGMGINPDMLKWMDQLFMGNGFRVDVIAYDEIAKGVGKDPPSGDYRNILFVAEQLRLSDAQMESWRQEFQRMEEEGDEDGFEEL